MFDLVDYLALQLPQVLITHSRPAPDLAARLVLFIPDQGFQVWHYIDVKVVLHLLAQMVLVGKINALLARPSPQYAQQYHANGLTIIHVLEQEKL